MRTIGFVLFTLLAPVRLWAESFRPPETVVCAHTLAILPHSDVSANMMEAAAKAIRKGEIFEVVQDPNQADLVMLFWDHLGIVMTGGAQPWNPRPLWIIHRENATQVAYSLRDEVEDARKGKPSCTVSEKQAGPETPLPSEAAINLLPDEILLKAKTVAIIDESYTAHVWPKRTPSVNQKTITRWLRDWGRFKVLADPAGADLILIWYDGFHHHYDFDMPVRGLLVFPNKNRANWNQLPTWMVEGHGSRLWHDVVTEPNLVKDLKKYMAKLEVQTGRAEPQKQ